MTDERCGLCSNWIYNDQTERTYGMGSGICKCDKEVKGCDRKACLLFCRRKDN